MSVIRIHGYDYATNYLYGFDVKGKLYKLQKPYQKLIQLVNTDKRKADNILQTIVRSENDVDIPYSTMAGTCLSVFEVRVNNRCVRDFVLPTVIIRSYFALNSNSGHTILFYISLRFLIIFNCTNK